MSKKFVQWLYQELPELVNKGILTREAAEKLHQYYGEVKSTSKKLLFLIICGALGALLIGLGVILILAHNWESFSRFTRAVLSFSLLLIGQILAVWVLWKRSQSGAFKEGVATFLSLMVGASLALICQTYNISGDPSDFTLTWMLLIVPLVYFMEATLPAVIYLIGITCWAGFYADNPPRAILFWPLATVVIPHFIWSLRKEIYTLRASILSFVMAISVCVGTGFSLGKTWPGSWMIIYPSIFSIFYFIGGWNFEGIHKNWQRSLGFIGGLGSYLLAYGFSFSQTWVSLDNMYFYTRNNVGDLSVLPDHIMTLAVIITALLVFYTFVKRKVFAKALLGLIPLLAIFCYSFGAKGAFLSMAIFNLYLFVLSIYWMLSGIRNNNLKTVNIGMLMLALLIIGRFFDSDIGFVIKGMAFIFVGVGFLVANAVLIRRRGGKGE